MKLYSCVFAATTAVAHGVSVQEYVQAHAVRALAVAKNAATLVENKRRLQDADASTPEPTDYDGDDGIQIPTEANDLYGILVEALPTACGTSEVNAMCGIYSDFSGLVSSATCRTTIGIDLTPDLSQALTLGLNCLNVMLCSRGSADTCFTEALALLNDPENNIGEGLENIGNIDIDDPVAFLTDACDNGCYTRLANTLVGGYEFAQDENGAACLAALGDESESGESPIPGMENPLPEVPSMDDVDLGLGFDLETYADEAVNFMQNACQRNAAGKYCVEVLANLDSGECVDVSHVNDRPGYYTCDCVPEDDDCLTNGACVLEPGCPSLDGQDNNSTLPVPVGPGADEQVRMLNDYDDDDLDFDLGCPGLEEAGEVCPIMEDLGCCASVILTNPFFKADAADRTCILNYGSEVCGIEQSLARPCTAGLATPVVIIESSTTLPACPHALCVNEQPVDEPVNDPVGDPQRMLNEDEDSVDETAFTGIIADAIGVDPSAIIITAVTVNEDMTTTVDYEVILKGTAAVASAANIEAIIADDSGEGTFTTAIANAAEVEAAAVVNTPPVIETIAPDTGGDESESNVAAIAGGVVGAVLVVGAVVGGVAVYKSRGSQQAASRGEGVGMSQQQKSETANQF
jgi:hypothetical protein